MLFIVFYVRVRQIQGADRNYIGKSARHLVTRAKEQWPLNSITRKSAVKEHILDRNISVKSDDI